jgi:hypothetical protein
MRGDGGLHLLAARIGGALGELRLKLRRFAASCWHCALN